MPEKVIYCCGIGKCKVLADEKVKSTMYVESNVEKRGDRWRIQIGDKCDFCKQEPNNIYKDIDDWRCDRCGKDYCICKQEKEDLRYKINCEDCGKEFRTCVDSTKYCSKCWTRMIYKQEKGKEKYSCYAGIECQYHKDLTANAMRKAKEIDFKESMKDYYTKSEVDERFSSVIKCCESVLGALLSKKKNPFKDLIEEYL